MDEVVEDELRAGVLEVVAAVVHDEERVLPRASEARREVEVKQTAWLAAMNRNGYRALWREGSRAAIAAIEDYLAGLSAVKLARNSLKESPVT